MTTLLDLVFDGLDDLLAEVRQLKKRRRFGSDGLDQVLRGAVGGENGVSESIGQTDGDKGFVEGKGGRCELVLFIVQSLVIKLNTSQVGPEQRKSLATNRVVHVLQEATVLLGQNVGFRKKTLLELASSSISLVPVQQSLELCAGTEQVDNTVVVNALGELLEHVASAVDQNLLARDLLRSVPPAADKVWKQDSQQGSVDDQNVFSITLGDQELRKGDTKAGALLAVGVSVFDKVSDSAVSFFDASGTALSGCMVTDSLR